MLTVLRAACAGYAPELLRALSPFGFSLSWRAQVYVRDVATAIVEALKTKATVGKVIELAGPKVYTYAVTLTTSWMLCSCTVELFTRQARVESGAAFGLTTALVLADGSSCWS